MMKPCREVGNEPKFARENGFNDPNGGRERKGGRVSLVGIKDITIHNETGPRGITLENLEREMKKGGLNAARAREKYLPFDQIILISPRQFASFPRTTDWRGGEK